MSRYVLDKKSCAVFGKSEESRLSSGFLLPVFFKSTGSYVLRKVSMTSCPECFDGGEGGDC